MEDEQRILFANKIILERKGGYGVQTATNLAEARKCVSENPPDIIVLDIMLPDGSGLDFLEELRRDSGIPVLLLTALSESADELKGIAAGGDDYITKPYNNDVLLGRIEMALRRAYSTPESLKNTIPVALKEEKAAWPPPVSELLEEMAEKLKHRERLLNAMNQSAEVLLTTDESNSLNALMKGMEIVGRCVDADRVQIWRNEVIDGELHFVMRYEWLSEVGRQKAEVPIGLKFPYSSVPGWLEMFLQGESINSPVSKLSTRDASFLGAYEMLSIVCLPLFSNKEFIGFFSVDDCRHEKTYTDDEMNMFASTGLMFTTVFNQSLQRDAACTDALTGAYNRHYLMGTADQELQNCLNKNMDFSLIMIDVDHFKSINDRFGHVIGDEVLKIFTERIRHVMKKDTPLSRYGGEEFVVTLSGVNRESAVNTAWRIHKNLVSSAFQVSDFEIKVTASFGVASATTGHTTLSEIINTADAALYQAKEAGRNTVVSKEGITGGKHGK
ncbi:MAG: diguanylate cyclase [Defluviitaleaceae bacterium]|nr:diguanylate cyclase [Defluviitaleaceae bacterium]